MKEAILYVHGKGGSVAESEHYKTLFPECEVIGLDYQTFRNCNEISCSDCLG